MNEIKKTHTFGLDVEYNSKDKSITINGKRFDASYMNEASKEFKGMNRIHKPIALLFWIDCKNNNLSNWELIK